MNTYTNIPSQTPPFQSGPGQKRLQGPAPQQYGNPAVQRHFNDVQMAQGQKAAMDFSRANTMAAADYTTRANAVQNQAVLGGLGQLAQQQQNAIQRDLAMQDMGYDWMGNMFNTGKGLLGGLL